jgi:hypothetical protein
MAKFLKGFTPIGNFQTTTYIPTSPYTLFQNTNFELEQEALQWS